MMTIILSRCNSDGEEIVKEYPIPVEKEWRWQNLKRVLRHEGYHEVNEHRLTNGEFTIEARLTDTSEVRR